MEKTKMKTPRTIQITYPAPYSQSWNEASSPIHAKNYGRRSNFLFNPKKKVESPKVWSQSYATVRGPDPTAPHLKYGVFPNRRTTSTRVLPKNQLTKSLHNTHNMHARPHPQDNPNKLSKKKPAKNGLESPMFVFRTIDKNNTKQLALSETMHVDIKPRKSTPMSPGFSPSPICKLPAPKFTVMPLAPMVGVQSNARAAQTTCL